MNEPLKVFHADGTEMVLFDEIPIDQIEETEIDPKTRSTTVHTGINFPDGGEGFIIMGRIVRNRGVVWQPLKDVIKRVLIEYHVQEKAENTSPAQEDTVQPEPDLSGSASDGEQALSGEPRSSARGRKRSGGV